MYQTTEEIPALHHMQRLIDLIKQYQIEYHKEHPLKSSSIANMQLIERSAIPKFWIAGGAIHSAITGSRVNDYDLFSDYPYAVTAAIEAAGHTPSFQTDHFANYYVDGFKVQVIYRYSPNDPQELFDTFDFTIVCGAYDGQTFYCHDRFWQDVAAKRLVVSGVMFPLRIMERMAKYAKKGYTPCPVGLLAIAKAIHALDIDWDDPDQNHLTFYTNGTPRFTGPD